MSARTGVKLASFDHVGGLDWDSGAYGFDAPDRSGLIAVAQERAERRHSATFTADNPILIGDTINDVSAGRHGGAHVIAVATGEDSGLALDAAGADVVLDDLTQPERLVTVVTSPLRK